MELHLVNLRPNTKISNKTLHTKKHGNLICYLGGETSSYKVVRAVRFARPCGGVLLSRNTGLGPDN